MCLANHGAGAKSTQIPKTSKKFSEGFPGYRSIVGVGPASIEGNAHGY